MALKVWGIGDAWGGRRVVAAPTQVKAAALLNLRGGAATLRNYGGVTANAVEIAAAMQEPGRVYATQGSRWAARAPDPFKPEKSQ